MRALTLFAGGGGSCMGMIQAGLTVTAAVEIDPVIAGVYRQNLGDHIVVADVMDLNPADFGPVDAIWASPPCPNFSVANQRRQESIKDLELADSIIKFIRCLTPDYIFIENVWQYHKSESWTRIRRALNKFGYWFVLEHVNAADFGVPQTRKRMIVRAILGQMVPRLPPAEPWCGWLPAISDLVDYLPLCPFANWQLKHLEPLLETTLVSGQYNNSSGNDVRRAHTVEHNKPAPTVTTGFGRDARAFVTSNNKAARGQGVRWEDQPAFSVTSQHVGIRAMLVSGNNVIRRPTIRRENEPAFTVCGQDGHALRACLVSGDNQSSPPTVRKESDPSFTIRNASKSVTRAWLENGRVVKLSPRCLARLQTFPDWYVLPEIKTLAGRIIGNAVPPLLAEKLVRATIP